MKMRKQVLALTIGILLVLSVFSVLNLWQIKPVQATDTLIDSYTSGPNSMPVIDGFHPSSGGSVSGTGTNFTCLGGNYKITSVKFYMNKTGSPTAVGNAVLYTASSSGPSGSALGTSDAFDFSTLTTTAAYVEILFSGANQYQMTQDAVYTIVIQAPTSGGTLDGSNYVAMGDNYVGSNGKSYTYQYSSWNSLTDHQRLFYVYGTLPSSNPTCGVSSPAYSTAKNWTSCTVSAQFNATGGGNISKVFIDQNVSGAWSGNITLTPTWINSTGCWGNYTMLLPAAINTVVGFKWFANDTSNNWVDSGNETLTTTANTIDYMRNAVWVQDASWVAMQQNILTANLSKLVADCGNNNISYAFVWVGNFNGTSNNINYEHTNAFYTNVINAFHAVNVKAIAWSMSGGGGTTDIRASNRQNIYNSIIACIYKGFDGYNDDIESYTGTLQEWIDYENNLTVVLHSMGKLSMPCVFLDWQQNINMHLNADFIVSMFYTATSVFEDASAQYYWKENFGLNGGEYGAPTSPMILGIMNYYGNTKPLCWQLAQAAYHMNTYSNRTLCGFALWLYEYVGTRSDDWAQWNYWINKLATAPATLYSVNLTSNPVNGVGMAFQGATQYTNSSAYSFNVSVSLVATSSFQSETYYSLFGMTNHSQLMGGAGGYNGYTYTSGPYTLASPATVSSVYFYSMLAGNVKIAIYNATTYTIPGWVGTNEHPHILQTQSSITAVAANSWNLITLSSASLSASDYFIAIKISAHYMIAGYSDGSSAFYGHGQYITQSYSTAFSSTFPTVEGAISSDPSLFVPSAPMSLTPYTFSEWEDSSTNPIRTVTTVTSNITVTAIYTSETVPSISLIYPTNSTYSSGTIPVNFTSSGGTIDQEWLNVLNGTSGSTWVYVSNQTFTGYMTLTGFVNGTYTGYFFANNTVPTTGYSTVVFTVQIITSEGGTSQLIVNVWWSGWW
jgi:hypothetical protein